ncbi:hypothetical protein ACVW1A_005769 [Bradyrhizobium sp. LB1.3]
MLQPDPALRPTMGEVNSWTPTGSAQTPAAPLYGFDPLRRPESAAPAPQDRMPSTARSPRSLRLGAGVAALLLLVCGGYAFYKLVWSAPGRAVLPPPPKLAGTMAPPKIEPAGPQPGRQEPEKLSAQPTATQSGALDGSGRAERIRKYVAQYSGGDCFFVLPIAVSPNAAVIEGFGASTAPFDTFDKAFRRDQGFEASVGVRQVTQAQCPAVKFLNQVGSDQARMPRITLSATELKGGETLNGTIENFANRVVELLMVSDRGEVQSLSYLLKPGIDSLSFTLPTARASGPQLLLVVAVPQVLDSLRQPRPMAADTFFLQALSEAQRNKVTVIAAARYVLLTN